MVLKLMLIAILFPLQSCSNTLIGDRLENSFDLIEKPIIQGNNTEVNEQKKPNKIKIIKSSKKNNEEKNENDQINITKNNSISNKDNFSQKSTKSIKKVIFKPQPYRIILKLSGVNPSAPAETVTNALRKAGVQFEVEKIERFDEKNLLKDSAMKR